MSVNGSSNGIAGSLPSEVRVAIVGAGFSGLGMAIRLRQAGIEDFVVFERANELGGTWQANTYPGCQCDVPSHLYSYSFALNPEWSRTYSRQEEIWAYLRGCADRFGVTPHVQLGCELVDADWDEDAQLWRLQTSRGPVAARMLVTGIGGLSEPRLPEIPGIEDFEGALFHSARWDHDHDLSGKRVAVIGTGASSIQFVPRIQRQVGQLHVFQRTPPWILPHSDRPVSRIERRLFRAFPWFQRAVRRGIYWSREWLVLGMTGRIPRLLRGLELAARLHLRRQVRDPELRARLRPDFRIGCKRILISDNYYPTLAKPNVELVTDGIREVRAHSIVTEDGTERPIDTIICGTGFYITDFPGVTRIRGQGGRSLGELWNGSPQAYLGTAVAGFPNHFMLLGPNTGLGHTSVVIMIEAQIRYVVECLRAMDERRLASVEVRPEVQDDFNREIQARMPGTVWNAGGCASWYIDASGRNSTIWPDFTFRYRQRMSHFDASDYWSSVYAPQAEAPAAPDDGLKARNLG